MQLNASLGAMSIRESIQNILNVVNSTESNCPYYIFKRKMLRTDWVALENMKQITNESNLTVRLEGTTSNYCHSKHSTSCWQNSASKMVMHGPLVSGTVIQCGRLSQVQWSNGATCLRHSDPMGPLVSRHSDPMGLPVSGQLPGVYVTLQTCHLAVKRPPHLPFSVTPNWTHGASLHNLLTTSWHIQERKGWRPALTCLGQLMFLTWVCL